MIRFWISEQYMSFISHLYRPQCDIAPAQVQLITPHAGQASWNEPMKGSAAADFWIDLDVFFIIYKQCAYRG